MVLQFVFVEGSIYTVGVLDASQAVKKRVTVGMMAGISLCVVFYLIFIQNKCGNCMLSMHCHLQVVS